MSSAMNTNTQSATFAATLSQPIITMSKSFVEHLLRA